MRERAHGPAEGGGRGRTLLRRALAAFYALLWGGGIVSYLTWGGPPAGSAWAAPAFLATAALLVLLAAPGRRRVLAFLAVGALGWGAEVLGVHTGFPFGDYRYTDHLAPLVLGVPVVLAAAWLVLAAWGADLTLRLVPRAALPVQVAIATLWTTAADLVIDPLAAGPLGYWRWSPREGASWEGIPLENFLGWLVVSLPLVIVLILEARSRHPGGTPQGSGPWQLGDTAPWVGQSVVAFFTVLAVALGLAVPAAVGAVLLAAGCAVLLRRPRSPQAKVQAQAQSQAQAQARPEARPGPAREAG